MVPYYDEIESRIALGQAEDEVIEELQMELLAVPKCGRSKKPNYQEYGNILRARRTAREAEAKRARCAAAIAPGSPAPQEPTA